MFKKHLLLLLLFALIAPWAANAQQTITVYETESGTNDYIPIYGYYSDSDQHNQMIYPASALATMGDGATISQMVFYIDSWDYYDNGYEIEDLGTWTVKLGETTATTLDGLDETTTLTEVFSDELVCNSDHTTMTIAFTSDYTYNGGNLLIDITHEAVDPYIGITFLGNEDVTSASIYQYEGWFGWSGDTQDFLPSVTFTYVPAAQGDCEKPETLVAENVTDQEASLIWTGGSGTYNVELKAGNGDWTPIATGITATTLPLNELTPGTAYQARVQSVCTGTEPSGFKTVSFTTELCMPEDQCAISYTLTDAYGDGWDAGAALNVVDVLTNNIIASWRLSSGYSSNGTLSLCPREVQFVWVPAPGTYVYNYECGFEVRDINGEILVAHEGCSSSSYCDAPTAGILYTWTVDCTVSSCKRPTDFTATEPGPNSVKLNWTENGEATSWIVAYKAQGENGFTEREVNNNVDLIFDGLTPETPYEVKVRPVCEVEKWSEVISFETTEACPAPYDVTVSPMHETANISWVGFSDTYTVMYREQGSAGATIFEEHFAGDDMPEGWQIMGEGTNSWSVSATNNAGGTANELLLNWTPSFTGISRLVTPAVNLTGISSVLFTCNLTIDWYEDSGTFGIATSSDNGTTWHDAYSFTHSDGNVTTTLPISQVLTTADMGNANVMFCFYYNGSSYCFDNIYVDDIVITEVVDNSWLIAPNGTNLTETTFNLTGLTMNTPYEVKVEGNCAGIILESEVVPFRTLDENTKFFVTEGNWNVSTNWSPVGEPTSMTDVIFMANATIPAGCVAVANNIDQSTYSLTIKDGGQLIHSNSGVRAIVEKEVTGYTGERDQYQLIAAPTMSNVNPANVANMLSNSYDLYAFDGTQELEWRNYETADFNMTRGKAYLYANSATVTLQFDCELWPIPGSGYISNILGNNLPYNANGEGFANWTLVGNPHPCNAYMVMCTYSYTSGYGLVSGYTDFYKMNPENGDEIIASTGAVAPMEGVFVVSAASNYRIVTSATPYNRGESYMNLNVSQSGKLIDVTRIRFAEGEGMEKIQLNPNHTKVYIPQEGKDYAVVYSEDQGEMPVCFKAETNGSYTIGFNTEEVSFSYLHLIDNMTGADVDLLATPSYSFEARTTDYASRFKLVFATGNNADGNFAFFSNGSFIINNEGNATLQVIDVTGRVIKSESINGCANVSVNAATGVYMLRLINGDDVKVQKVVVR